DAAFGEAWPAANCRCQALHSRQTARIDPAIYREVADGRRASSTTPRCCRTSSIARRPFGGILSATDPFVVFPLAVPFAAIVPQRVVSNLGVTPADDQPASRVSSTVHYHTGLTLVAPFLGRF